MPSTSPTLSAQRSELRDKQLMILVTPRNSGNVFVCVDTVGRVPIKVTRRRIKLSGQELQQYKEKVKRSSSKHHSSSSLVEDALVSESNSDTEKELPSKAGDAYNQYEVLKSPLRGG